MDLGSPLATLSGPIDAAVLRILARTYTTLHGRQIHRLAGIGSQAGVNAALTRLVAAGLVTSSVKSYATLYRLNRDHILWPVVEAVLSAVGELRSRIRQYAIDFGPADVTVALYGSVHSGSATADSDVDLLVVIPDDVTGDIADDFVYELGERVRVWTGNPAQIITLSRSELRESSHREDALVDTWPTDSDVLLGSAIPVGA